MAGPYHLEPGTQYNIPTSPLGRLTKVVVTNSTDYPGRVSMTAGGSATEFEDVGVGSQYFWRDFAGVQLAVKNESQDVPLTIETQ